MRLKKFREFLREKLSSVLSPEELELLPKGYQMLGNIMLLRLHPKLRKYGKLIGRLLKERYRVKSVCLIEGVYTPKRSPKVEVLAGSSTRTRFRENRCVFEIDVREFMWAKGNVGERLRITRLVKDGEEVLDLFAGIGYFSIPIAKLSNPKLIVAIDINPKAVRYLKKNIKLNNVERKVFPLVGNSLLASNFLRKKFDRVLLGILPSAGEVLEVGLKLCKGRGTLHFHCVLSKGGFEEAKRSPSDFLKKKFGKELGVIGLRKVKGFGPNQIHAVFDLVKSRVLEDY